METKNYEISVKKWGWTTMSFDKFVRKYYAMEDRIKIISNPKKCSVSHVYENRELTSEEAFELFSEYDYYRCEKSYYDFEQYLSFYWKYDFKSVQKAKKALEMILFEEPSERTLSNYLTNFPKGLYHEQVRALLEK